MNVIDKKQLKFYKINDEYLDYLYEFDSKVPLKENRPYVRDCIRNK